VFLLSLFAAGGVLLAAIGVYGLLRYAVMQRSQDEVHRVYRRVVGVS
jgi:hypothetical protein